ncbi:hypothetical protein [Caulobacter sp. LARHSG274]
MSALAEFFAAIMLWLSAMALCQFGVAFECQVKAPHKVERTVARSPRQEAVESTSTCPHRQTVAVSA